MSTLITAANSAQAQQLKKLLPAGEILLGDYHEMPGFMVKSGQLVQVPNPDSPSYIHQLLAFCLDKGIDKVFPLRTAELLLLAEARQLFAEFGITLFVPQKGFEANGVTGINRTDEITIIMEGPASGVYLRNKIFTAD